MSDVANKSNKEVKLSSLLKEKFIELCFKGKNKKEIIAELVGVVSQSGKIKDKKAFTKALIDREKLGSTAIGNGVAIPHAKIDGLDKILLAFGRVDAGVDFSSLDGEKTYIFFALASSKKEIGAHLKVLASVSHLIKDKFIVELLKKANNKKEVLKIISSSEKN
mgnify:CR=1 FL=1